MAASSQSRTRQDESQVWRGILELSAESEQLLNMAMALGNFDRPDEALKEALHYYVDSQSGVELRPETAASLHTALRPAGNMGTVSPQDQRERIHRWILDSCSAKPQ